ncbi:uncharacterized protein MONOS_17277 [Monocercomonoides exilis]|uniref:uncharacterized protein n=1 Tax=Monocercomonoides exilis TaxID=2049356 RepID=UPI003559EE07|nr:hypothetical protein MONOS_17277 [Monocercomonoides exilis]
MQGAGICGGASGQRGEEDVTCGGVCSDVYEWELDTGKITESQGNRRIWQEVIEKSEAEEEEVERVGGKGEKGKEGEEKEEG